MIQFIAINVTTDVIKPDQECHVNVIINISSKF